ncbi:MAG: hypothetical protein KGH62_05660, partial [Candidatus Micrarchaeota archaeon]|nr:hypothetical protein [Candidatus Micrarchaeota archaeon]
DLFHAKQVIGENNRLTISFQSQIYGINRSYDQPRLEAITRSKSVYEKELTTVTSSANKKRDAFRVLLPNIQPDVKISDANEERLLQVQKGNDAVVMLDSNDLSINQLANRVRDGLKTISEFEGHKLALLRVSMSQRKAIVEAKLDLAFSTSGIEGVIIPYANPEYAYSKIALLRRYATIPKWIHMQGIPKYSANDGKTSLMHLLAMYGIDSFSLKAYPHFNPTEPPDVKRLDWGSLAYLDFPNEHRQRYENRVECSTNCPPDYKATVNDIVDTYSPEKLPSYTRVHEAYESQFGFFTIRNRILGEKRALFDLIKSKDIGRTLLHEWEGIDFEGKMMVNKRL